MFTVAAFLPFLPLIEDAMIRQLGNDDFAKREAATRFLVKVLRDTDGLRNYSALVKVHKATEHRDAEISRRAENLYLANKSKYILDYPYCMVILKGENIGKNHDAAAWKNIEKELGRNLLDMDRGLWTKPSYSDDYYLGFRTIVFDTSKLYRLKNNRNFKEFIPLNNSRQAWSEAMQSLRER
jgi:hypothetical protein